MSRLFQAPMALMAVFVWSSACSVVGNEGEVQMMPAVDFAVIEQESLTVDIEVTGTWRNTCGLFARFETSARDSTYVIEMLGRAPRNVICEQTLTEVSGVWSGTVPGPGIYRFEFSRGIQDPLDTLLVFGAP